MKLIDILVRELPKYGGWPVGVGDIEMLSDGTIYFDGDEAPESFKLPQCDDGWSRLKSAKDYSNAVTREQYEGALAASKTEWDGEGFPPVGCECQYSLNGGVAWFDCRIEYLVGSQGVVMSCEVFEGIQYASASQYDLKFRPIRSEADKKRDESIKALKFSFGAFDANGLAEMVYQAIASGKIPHIRID